MIWIFISFFDDRSEFHSASIYCSFFLSLSEEKQVVISFYHDYSIKKMKHLFRNFSWLQEYSFLDKSRSMIHVTNTVVYLIIIFLLSFRANLIEANCSNETRIIGCGGDRFVNVTHIVHLCEYQLYTRVTLPKCRVENSNDTLFWYTYNDLCQNGLIFGKFFVSVNDSGGETCREFPNSTISTNTCKTDYDYNRDTIIIKNLTQSTVKRYICFPGSNQIQIKSALAVSYIISIEGMSTIFF